MEQGLNSHVWSTSGVTVVDRRESDFGRWVKSRVGYCCGKRESHEFGSTTREEKQQRIAHPLFLFGPTPVSDKPLSCTDLWQRHGTASRLCPVSTYKNTSKMGKEERQRSTKNIRNVRREMGRREGDGKGRGHSPALQVAMPRN